MFFCHRGFQDYAYSVADQSHLSFRIFPVNHSTQFKYIHDDQGRKLSYLMHRLAAISAKYRTNPGPGDKSLRCRCRTGAGMVCGNEIIVSESPDFRRLVMCDNNCQSFVKICNSLPFQEKFLLFPNFNFYITYRNIFNFNIISVADFYLARS